jgi:MoxR-like ATPase
MIEDRVTEEMDLDKILEKSRHFMDYLNRFFIERNPEVELMMIASIAQEPILFVGPPGTGKSGLVTTFAKAMNLGMNEYFEYMLTKFTEPSELLGPLDLKRMKAGEYFRRTTGKLPEAKIAFLDEIFKSNSAILNTLLTVLNERKFYQDGKPHPVPLKILFAATNEIPALSELDALKDRFVLKVKVDRVQEQNWEKLVFKGLANEARVYKNQTDALDGALTFAELEYLHHHLMKTLNSAVKSEEDPYFPDSLFLEFKRLIKTILHDFEVDITDRKLIKLYKLIRARALLFRGGGVEKEDLCLLAHVGNHEEEIDFLREKIPELIQ